MPHFFTFILRPRSFPLLMLALTTRVILLVSLLASKEFTRQKRSRNQIYYTKKVDKRQANGVEGGSKGMKRRSADRSSDFSFTVSVRYCC